MCFDLAAIIAHNDSDVRIEDTCAVITTPESQWAYAAEIPRAAGEPAGKVRISVSIDCLFGTIGVALLHRDGAELLAESLIVGRGQIANLQADSLDEVKSIVIRNGSERGQSSAIVKEIEIAPDLEEPALRIIDDRKFRQFGAAIGLPRRRERQLDPAVAALLPSHASLIGSILQNAYVKEVLGKKTFGRVLTIGAAGQSLRYRYDLRIQHSEYHTLDPNRESKPTFIADARKMPEVPTSFYDWVLAIEVFDYVSDMHAMVAEMRRVLKPGGYLYLMCPFQTELHFKSSFGDYQSISPFGIHEVRDGPFSVEEVEYWGDCLIEPAKIGIFARIGAAAATQSMSRLYYIDGGMETVRSYVRGDLPFRWNVPISRLRIDDLEYSARVQNFRSEYFSKTGHEMTNRQAEQHMFRDLAIPEGVLAINNEGSRLIVS